MKSFKLLTAGMLTGLFALGTIGIKGRFQNPEKLIVGTWYEKSWKYEKMNPADLSTGNSRTGSFDQDITGAEGRPLFIHSAETWKFNPDGTLLLQKGNAMRNMKWRLKGRGHILEVKHDDKVAERYNISELTKDRIVFNFDSDMQVKGIATLIFEK